VATKNLPDLIEDNAARYGVAQRELWGWALDAIEKDVLRPDLILPEKTSKSLDTEFSHGGMGPLTLRKIISARRRVDRYDPSTENWAKCLMFDTAAFERWLKKTLLAHRIPAHPKRAAGRKKTKRESVASLIAEIYPDGVPDGITVKVIAREIEAKKKELRVSERTVRRALGRA
jgi:hypothetical protein